MIPAGTAPAPVGELVVEFHEDRPETCACGDITMADPEQLVPDPIDDRFTHGSLVCVLADDEVVL